MKPKGTPAQQKAFRNYAARANAKLIAAFRKPKPPTHSYWCCPPGEPRAEFYARLAKEYDARLKGFGQGNDTFN